jgi:hypothetical protein
MNAKGRAALLSRSVLGAMVAPQRFKGGAAVCV